MSKFYLHIGMPKTGTSLIQNVLPRIRTELEAANIWTPERPIESHRVAVEASPNIPSIRNRHDYLRIFELGDDNIFEKIRQETDRGRDVLLSSEYFSDCDPEEVRTLLSALEPSASFQVIVYVRRQDRFIESSYNQEVKASGRTTHLHWDENSDARYHWGRRIGAWGDCFGDEAIKLMVFDELTNAKEKRPLSASLLDQFGISIERAKLEEYESGDERFHNRSLSAELLEFRRLANMVSDIGEIDWLIEKAHKKEIGKTKFAIDAGLARKITAHYQPSNDALAKRFLGRDRLFDDRVDDRSNSEQQKMDAETLSMIVATLSREVGALRRQLRRLERAATGKKNGP